MKPADLWNLLPRLPAASYPSTSLNLGMATPSAAGVLTRAAILGDTAARGADATGDATLDISRRRIGTSTLIVRSPNCNSESVFSGFCSRRGDAGDQGDCCANFTDGDTVRGGGESACVGWGSCKGIGGSPNRSARARGQPMIELWMDRMLDTLPLPSQPVEIIAHSADTNVRGG